MSFASHKKSSLYFKENSRDKIAIPFGKNLFFESTTKHSTFSSPKYNLYSNDPILARFEMIETNLNRVINQHEALLPLLNSQTDLQTLNKHEFTVNILKTKLKEDEKSFKTLEFDLKDYQMNFDINLTKVVETRNEKSVEIQNLEKGMKGTNNMINGLQSNLKDVESTVLNFQRLSDAKFKDLSQSVIAKVDTRTQRNQDDAKKIITEFENYIKKSLCKKMEILNEIFPHPVILRFIS